MISLLDVTDRLVRCELRVCTESMGILYLGVENAIYDLTAWLGLWLM